MRSLLTRGVVALVVAGSLAAATPVAHAETLVVRDPRHDVKRVVQDAQGDATLSRAPRQRSADVTRLRVTHGFKQITVGVTLRDLVRDETQVLNLQMRLPGGDVAFVSASSFERRWSTFAMVGNGDGYRECRAWTTPRPARDRLVVTLPRRCLGRPEWVRTNVRVASITGTEAREVGFVDAVHQPAGFGTSVPRYGPKVHVG